VGDNEQALTEALFRRGQEVGAVRSDVPLEWHVQSFGALLLSALGVAQQTGMGVEDTAELLMRQFLHGARTRDAG
jgi:hypothetical protein